MDKVEQMIGEELIEDIYFIEISDQWERERVIHVLKLLGNHVATLEIGGSNTRTDPMIAVSKIPMTRSAIIRALDIPTLDDKAVHIIL